jgi:alkyl sulfatase BDS1-like metallo-beta-lactamase superfamily hydrolase
VRTDRKTEVGAPDKGIADGSITAEGDTTTLRTLIGLLDTFDPQFNVVTPNAAP